MFLTYEGEETKDMNSCWRIGDSPGCGEGVFATRTIKTGEEVGFAEMFLLFD